MPAYTVLYYNDRFVTHENRYVRHDCVCNKKNEIIIIILLRDDSKTPIYYDFHGLNCIRSFEEITAEIFENIYAKFFFVKNLLYITIMYCTSVVYLWNIKQHCT